MPTSNSYGFDFLKSEHKLDETANHEPTTVSSTAAHGMIVDSDAVIADAHNKPDLEKQFDILAFLQKHRDSSLAPSLIYRATGIDLESDVVVANMLQNNPKIRTEFIPDPENPALQVAHYAYQAKYGNVRDRTTLLAQINRMFGVPMRDLLDSYDTAADDINALITAGDVIAIQNTEDKDKILFPRGGNFFVELDGLLSLPDVKKESSTPSTAATSDANNNGNHNGNNSKKSPKVVEPTEKHEEGKLFVIETDVDPRKQIRRGEAVQVGGQWFRVSSAVRAGVPLSEQPARAQAPLSVVSLTDLSERNEIDGYIRPFTSKQLPLDNCLSEAAQKNVLAARQSREKLSKLIGHGRSGGVLGQLIGSYAHASNPTALAASVATAAPGMHRKRPNAAKATSSGTAAGAPVASKAELLAAADDQALALYGHARRHGCTRDVREMYLKTRAAVPESDHDLHQVLLKHNLLEPGEQMRRPRLAKSASNVDNDGKPKKRRYYERKNQRITNTHLEGTEIGAILMRAAETQKQGKSVGDGGM